MNDNRKSRTPIRVGNRVIGYVRGDTYFKEVNGALHFMTTPAGIANDISALQDAKAAGASWINIKDKKTGRVYIATIEMIFDKGIRFNRGWGNQINLLFQYWTTSLDISSKALKAGEVRHAAAKKPRIRNERSVSRIPAQLSLFG